ncbi:MAG: hypothetical protein KAF64_11965 [Hydrogenophaga sp.]|uniref:hypothetical protein n=1 Tax=Hydrogenophaga sp. TaxID=1904254 RepID=UPI0025C2C4CA|nr:hypothetical protein [Hydrogenophaga sp.]MBU7574064.1 hypothetical protein [Hydrogenophaga sp.]
MISFPPNQSPFSFPDEVLDTLQTIPSEKKAPDTQPIQLKGVENISKLVFEHFSDPEKLDDWANTKCSLIRECLEKTDGFGNILHRYRQQRLQITRDAEKDWGDENRVNTDRVLKAIEQLPASQQRQPLVALVKKYATWLSDRTWPAKHDLTSEQFKKMAFLVATSFPREKTMWECLASLTRRLPRPSIGAALDHLLPPLIQDNGWSPQHRQMVLPALIKAVPKNNPPEKHWDCILTAYDNLPLDRREPSLNELMLRLPSMNDDLASRVIGRCLKTVQVPANSEPQKALNLLFHIMAQCVERKDKASFLDGCSISMAIPYSPESLMKKLEEKNSSARDFLQSMRPDVKKTMKAHAIFLRKMALEGIESSSVELLAKVGRHYMALYPPAEWMSVLDTFHKELPTSQSKAFLFNYMEKLKNFIKAGEVKTP